MCEPAPQCQADGDCDSGNCNDGFCHAGGVAGSEAAQDTPRHWLWLHLAGDLAIVSGHRLCALEGWNDNCRCYRDEQLLDAPGLDPPGWSELVGEQNARYQEPPIEATSIDTPATYSSTRVLGSYEFARSPAVRDTGRPSDKLGADARSSLSEL